MGKSAQLGLHVWLPDAMEGPTPVSALIHAATMVTAGVFLLARCSMLFEYSEFALNVITIIGSITCIFAATIAVTQSDIKKIIAYSTCSQLGYMFFSCGVSAYSAALFHLFTHAFFKALLFLGAGNVIHATLDEQNIFKMGGLARKIKITYAFFWIGSLALAGIPPFAGFFSKDAILEAAYAKGEYMAYFFGIVAAFLTAFYSWRLIFHGNSNISHEQSKKIHEAEGIMIFPLIFLAVGSIAFGAIGALRWNMESAASNFWNNAIINIHLSYNQEMPHILEYLPILVGIFGILFAYFIYYMKNNISQKIAERMGIFYLISKNKYYFDEIYNFVFVKGSKKLGDILWKLIDINIIDGAINSIAAFTIRCARTVSAMHTGYIYHYATGILIGMIVLLYLYIA